MLSQEQFVLECISSFKAIREDISKKHGETQGKIEELCEKYTKLHGQLNTHLKVEEKLAEYKKEQEKALISKANLQERKNSRKFYILFGLMTAGFTIYEITKELI